MGYEKPLSLSPSFLLSLFSSMGGQWDNMVSKESGSELSLGQPHPALQREYVTQLSPVPAAEELLVRAGQGKQRRTKQTLPWVGSFHPLGTAGPPLPAAAGPWVQEMLLLSTVPSPGISRVHLLSSHGSCRPAAPLVAHAVVLTHTARSFCFSLHCQCDKAAGLHDRCMTDVTQES